MRKNFFLPDLSERYRKSPRSFTRNRKLPFRTVCFLILQKSTKSLRNKLNEYFDYVSSEATSASAFTQARRNLCHELFIDFNRESYCEAFYEGEHERFGEHRLLSIDGSRLRLPDTDEIREEFGASKIKLKHTKERGSFAGAFCSVLYDILNENVIDSNLAHVRSSERVLAAGHLEHCRKNDLLLLDRGYTSYKFFAQIIAKKAGFICRCSSNSFKVVESFIADSRATELLTTLSPQHIRVSKDDKKRLPKEIKIRLLKFKLPSGEMEVLATTLLDKETYPKKVFYELYKKRWGIETYYDRLKNKLAVENFSGKTVEAVKQDFYSTILISNLESEVTNNVNQELDNKDCCLHKQKVNKAVSYNSIKNHVIELIMSPDEDLESLTEKLEYIFRKNTIPIRDQRSVNRTRSTRSSLNFHMRRKKHVF